MFIVDRPVVLQSVYQLLNSLSDRKILTWDFFLSRFDTLFIEAQVNLEKNGDLAYLRDLRNSENGSEILISKISKAREALSQSSESSGSRKMIKTLSASFGKWQYKRTMSAPANITLRQESKSGEIFEHLHLNHRDIKFFFPIQTKKKSTTVKFLRHFLNAKRLVLDWVSFYLEILIMLISIMLLRQFTSITYQPTPLAISIIYIQTNTTNNIFPLTPRVHQPSLPIHQHHITFIFNIRQAHLQCITRLSLRIMLVVQQVSLEHACMTIGVLFLCCLQFQFS